MVMGLMKFCIERPLDIPDRYPYRVEGYRTIVCERTNCKIGGTERFFLETDICCFTGRSYGVIPVCCCRTSVLETKQAYNNQIYRK